MGWAIFVGIILFFWLRSISKRDIQNLKNLTTQQHQDILDRIRELEVRFKEIPVSPIEEENKSPIEPPVTLRETFTAAHQLTPTDLPKEETPPAQPKSFSLPPELPYVDIDEAVTKVFHHVVNYFKTGNTIVKVGVVILFFGISFLVKYAADRGILPIEYRLVGAALGGIVLTQFGWRLKEQKRTYALVLQGGGVGILFITIFAAFRIYHLLPATLAFALLASLATFTAILAILQDSRSLAAFGIAGGFLAPILASTGQGNHVILFSYYALLNTGIFAMAWFKAWRILNLLGFAFTYIIGTTWGILKYKPEDFATTEPFLIFFFLLYVAIAILYARKEEPKLKGYVDGTIVFGNTIIAFGLQTQLVKPFEYATAYSALAVSAFYLTLGTFLYRMGGKYFRMLVEAFVALGVVFATLTIPLAFDGYWTAAIWAVEAAGIYWVSIRQDRLLGRAFSSLLILAAGISFLFHRPASTIALPFFNSFYLGCLFIAVGSIITSYLIFVFKDKIREEEKFLEGPFFIYGILWWVWGGYIEIERHFTKWWYQSDGLLSSIQGWPAKYENHLSLAYFSLSALLSIILAKRLRWNFLNRFAAALIAFMAFAFLRLSMGNTHPLAYGGIVVWPLAIALYYFVLYRNEQLTDHPTWLHKSGHVFTLWLLTLLVTAEITWQVRRFLPQEPVWSEICLGLIPLGIISVITFKKNWLKWPVVQHWKLYFLIGLGPIITLLWLWAIDMNFFVFPPLSFLPHIPIFNPQEMVQALIMLFLPIWLLKAKHLVPKKTLSDSKIAKLLGFTYFLWLNAILLKAIHHYANVPFDSASLFHSVLVQASLSIYWSLIGILLMIFGTRKVMRKLWIVGASVIGVVVVKLFLIDLANTETVARIVSFISVGVLLLIVGYFSPIPPQELKESKE